MVLKYETFISFITYLTLPLPISLTSIFNLTEENYLNVCALMRPMPLKAEIATISVFCLIIMIKRSLMFFLPDEYDFFLTTSTRFLWMYVRM